MTLAHKVYSLAIKVYDEQLLYSWDYVCDIIRKTDSRDFQVIGIRHDRDVYAEDDSFWLPASLKHHYHIIFRCVDRNKRIRVGTVLNQLGIRFRQGLDDNLIKEHALETVGKFEGYATYLTHETEDAIRDGKELYDISELVSNLTCEEIKEVRQGYLLVGQNSKMTIAEWVKLDRYAYDLGKQFGNYEAWYSTLPFNARSGSKIKTIRESYERGVRDAVNENPEVLRTCIFIKGEPNQGKTYAATHALGIPHDRILTVEGGHTGKFDRLQPYTDAIVINDDVCPNLLNIADDYKCQVYRRGSNNPYWNGTYLIATSNMTFEEWLTACGLKIYEANTRRSDMKSYAKHYYAMETRFFVCHITDDRRLVLDSPASRGTHEEQLERLERFRKFKLKFNEIIAGYVPGPAVDYDTEIAPESLPADRAIKAHPEYVVSILVSFSDWFWNGSSDKSPWKKVRKKSSTASDKVDYLDKLPDNAIRTAAIDYKDYAVLEKIHVDMIRGFLRNEAREYDVDDEAIIETV